MRKRSAYRQRWARVNPIDHAIRGASITTRAELDKLKLRELSSLDAFVNGKATIDTWHDIAATNNLAQSLSDMGIGQIEVGPLCKEVEQHLIEAAQRHQRTGRMALTGPAIQAIRDLLEYHDLQRSSVARSVYEEAIRIVIAKLKSGHHVKALETK